MHLPHRVLDHPVHAAVPSLERVRPVPYVRGEGLEVVESPPVDAVLDVVEEILTAQAEVVVQCELEFREQDVCEALECFLSVRSGVFGVFHVVVVVVVHSAPRLSWW